MSRRERFQRTGIILVLAALSSGLALRPAAATEIVMKDGRVLKGKLGLVAGLAEAPQPPQADGSGAIQLIVLLDDDLRRTFVSKRQVQEVRQEGPAEVLEKFHVRQRLLRAGPSVKSVGPILHVQPFDEFGRRIFSMNTSNGKADIIQGITEITPEWTKVEGISHLWDMRMATSNIPRDTLHKILLKQIDAKNVEHCKKIARFYLQSQRYPEAEAALRAILELFPNKPELKDDLAPSIRAIHQLAAKRMMDELTLRREAGQHKMVLGMLKKFPSEDVNGELLQSVREMIEQYDNLDAQRKAVLEQFDALVVKIDDKPLRERLKPVRDELVAELNSSTMDRMAAFRQNADDAQMGPPEKLALAISGWLVGSNTATVKLPVALSLYHVRDLVRQYLSEPIKLNRQKIFGSFASEEGATTTLVAALIAHMKPPVETPPAEAKTPGLYELEVPGLPKDAPFRYCVQLPPEYDPYRRYPAVLTLQGAGSTALQQIDWWAGAWDERGLRTGQATRYGYIIIAPQWTGEHQRIYSYSAREHAAALYTLRDACRRFSIDTDRVFLSGHSIGGDAAWDIGLAHPDLWAGVIPIVGAADKFCALYWENAKHVPFYVIGGELDGQKLAHNARDLDRYLRRGYNTTVVEFQGRGHENFSDEVLRLFDWMGRFKRDFFPREFICSTMRPWDNFFWWVELEGMPPKSMIDPESWPPPRGAQPVQVKGSVTAKNGLYIRTGSTRLRAWLSPEMVDFSQPISVVVNGHRVGNTAAFQPSLETLLEDVRTRGDRRHPFWAKIEAPTGRVPKD